jgi:predicted polyphosphate/ATP-dependent NAD kinase
VRLRILQKSTVFMSLPLVGIIANPASGRDIRRLVAQGTVFDNNEKTAIVRRVLLGLEAVGISRVAYMPEHDYGIIPRALSLQSRETQKLRLAMEPLAMAVTGTGSDSTKAARLLAEMGAQCIITLGGDGTNRTVARGCGDVPILPISTGTNNVFPSFLEGTIAGIAAGLVALQQGGAQAIRRVPWLEISVNGETRDYALIDVAISDLSFIGSRAIWDLSTVREVVLSRVTPATIGLSALGGALLDANSAEEDAPGMHIVLGQSNRQVLVPLAPGLITWVGVTAHKRLAIDSVVELQSRSGTIALDGEREIELPAAAYVTVKLRADGPHVVDVPATVAAAVRAGYLQRSQTD